MTIELEQAIQQLKVALALLENIRTESGCNTFDAKNLTCKLLGYANGCEAYASKLFEEVHKRRKR